MDLLTDFPDDPVSSLLDGLAVRSNVYCLSELRAPWGFAVEGRSVAKFHLVLEGAACLQIDDHPTNIELCTGDLVLLPHGHRHSMTDDPASPVERLDVILTKHPLDDAGRMYYGGEGTRCRLLCGGFGLDAIPELLLPLLPTVIRIDSQSSGINAWLSAVFDLIRAESSDLQPGARAIFSKLADVFLAQALRRFLISLEESRIVTLAPLGDKQVAAAVALIHSDPNGPWSVAGLAAEVGMSRSGFTQRFRTAVGEPPMKYVTRLRLSRAAGYLATTDMSIYAIAKDCGYDTDESLSKAFKRTFDISPGRYRAQASKRPLLTATPAVN